MAKTSETAAVTTGGPLRVDTISLKSCEIDGKVALDYDDGVKVHVARITGMANGIKRTRNRTTGDDMLQLKGDFECFNPVTNKTYFSALAYLLAGGTQDVVEAPIEAAEVAGEVAEVPFAVDYYATANTRPGTGRKAEARFYDYSAEYLIAPERHDMLAALRSKLPPMPGAPAKVVEAPAEAKAD